MSLRAAVAAGLLFLAAPAVAQAPEPFDGTWDLFWATRDGGTKQEGWLVIDQTGPQVAVQIHGKGNLRASGTAEGDGFRVQGRKMGAPFTISGRLVSGRLRGSVKVLTVDRRFEGVRRR